MAWVRLLTALAYCALALSCSVYSEELLVGVGGAATVSSSTTGSTGSGGSEAECTTPDSCPGQDTACQKRSCDEGNCGTENSDAGSSCTEGGGKVCDGQGSCVQCLTKDDCASDEVCSSSNTCVTVGCDNELKDGTESDVDCGGDSCPACADGKICGDFEDCQSLFCKSGICAKCASAADCHSDDYCDIGATEHCLDELVNSASCNQSYQCSSGICVDSVCCEASCGGGCESCNLSGSQGSCKQVAEGQDPDLECGADVCNGAGKCRCKDAQKNGGETDADCGGAVCEACADGKTCSQASDCQSGVCQGSCQPPSCTDSVKNGSETDKDCGGACPLDCDPGQACLGAGDCKSKVCNGGLCQVAVCGDNVTNGNEQCDDGKTESFDGCSASCLNEADHLLLSELVVTPTNGEFVEIYNPTVQSQSLANTYIADINSYYLLTKGQATPSSTDFLIRFPPAAQILKGGFVVVSLQSAALFQGIYGKLPDYDLDAMDAGAPAMLGSFGNNSGLTNGGEILVLFNWDGISDLVRDVDYVAFGVTGDKIDKSGVKVGNGTYLSDTPVGNQTSGSAPNSGKSLHRCHTSEDTETKQNGNGITGHDETSESSSSAWKIASAPTPGAAPALGFCP